MPSDESFLDHDRATDDACAELAVASAQAASAMPGLFGIRLSDLGMDEIVATLARPPSGTEALPLFTLNVAHVTSLSRDEAFRRAYRAAWLVTIDGMPVYLMAKAKGLRTHKVPGSDLVARIFATRNAAMRAFFVASSRGTADGIRGRLVARGFAEGALAFDVPPFGFERDDVASQALAARIRAHGTTHLFMGVGAPKSEIWVVRWRRELGGCYALCVGAGLDYLAGTRARAPVALQKTGLEWVWRLGSEPRRLARRYLFDAFAFVSIVIFRRLDIEK